MGDFRSHFGCVTFVLRSAVRHFGRRLLLPLGLTVALTALELLVAFLQAYVFAILTCIYLNDAIHPGH